MGARKGSHAPRRSKRIPVAVVGVVASSEATVDVGSASSAGSRRFVEGDPHTIFIGPVSLEVFLRDTPLRWVLDLDRQLRDLDWTLFDSGLRKGRPPTHPRILAGLILYGILRGQTSLRALETLAATDLGAWWICGGLRPDHSTLGDFILTHQKALARDVFVLVTRSLVRSLGLSPSFAALDGTVVEAAGSHFQILRKEAALAARDRAAAAVTEAAGHATTETGADALDAPTSASTGSPVQAQAETTKAQQGLAHHQQVLDAVEERIKARRAHGGDTEKACVCATDLGAIVQPRKDKVMRPAWKPSVIAHPSGLLVGQHLEPSSEQAAVLPLLTQHHEILGAFPDTTLVDGNYLCESVLQCFVTRDLDVLCPVKDSTPRTTEAGSKLGKHLFVYQPQSDTYVCPQGRELVARGQGRQRDGQRVARYVGRQCGDCPRRAECTTGASGRMIKRFAVDEWKEAMGQILRHPQAQALYGRRLPTVEPIFGVLRDRQGLVRFHRRGRRAVAAEFSLHCIAYNLRKAQRLAARRRAARARRRMTNSTNRRTRPQLN